MGHIANEHEIREVPKLEAKDRYEYFIKRWRTGKKLGACTEQVVSSPQWMMMGFRSCLYGPMNNMRGRALPAIGPMQSLNS